MNTQTVSPTNPNLINGSSNKPSGGFLSGIMGALGLTKNNSSPNVPKSNVGTLSGGRRRKSKKTRKAHKKRKATRRH